MNRALEIIKGAPKAGQLSRFDLICEQTGERATLTEWAAQIAAVRGVKISAVRHNLLDASLKGRVLYGVVFRRVESGAP